MATRKKTPATKKSRKKDDWVEGPCVHCHTRTTRKHAGEPLVCGGCFAEELHAIRREFPERFPPGRPFKKLFAVTAGVFRLWHPQPVEQCVQ
jgi:hypothetical protein